MNIKLWHCAAMGQWRWVMTDDRRPVIHQESGQQPDLRTAMADIANTVEHILNTEQ